MNSGEDLMMFSNHTYDLFGASHAIPDSGSSVPYPVLYFIVHPLVHHGVQAAVSRRAGVGLVSGRLLTFAENSGHRVPVSIWSDLECRNYIIYLSFSFTMREVPLSPPQGLPIDSSGERNSPLYSNFPCLYSLPVSWYLAPVHMLDL